MKKVSDMLNIGSTIERQLNEVGIITPDDLRAVGTEQAWLKIQEKDTSACVYRLLALEGAIQGLSKAMLPEKRKEELKEFYRQNKK